MRLEKAIQQMMDYCPTFNRRIYGAANFLDGVDTTFVSDMPYAAVYPLGTTAGEALGLGASLKQYVTERLGVCVVFDNSADRRGQEVAELITNMRIEILGSLYNFFIEPGHAARGLYYVGDKDLSFDRGRIQWEFEFALDVTITYMDGFLPTKPKITAISVTNTGPQGAEMSVQQDFVPPS